MQTLRRKLEEQAKITSSRLDIVQQDYLLTCLLGIIGNTPMLKDDLVFKGGTALKKCYFGEYRFSEDLDFTAKPSASKGISFEKLIINACADTERAMGQHGPVRVIAQRYREKQRHPHEQEAFAVYAQFPWQRKPLTRVMIEVTRSEELALPPCSRRLLHPYGEELTASITTYSLDEIILEKLRAILQQTKKLHERSWSRSRARDYYDLWYILYHTQYTPQSRDLLKLLAAKCDPKNVIFRSSDDFFSPIMVADVTRTWERWVGSLVNVLPPVDQVINELREAVKALFQGNS